MYRCARYKDRHFINFNFQFTMNEELLYRKFSGQYFPIIPYIKTYLINFNYLIAQIKNVESKINPVTDRPIDSPVKLKCENKYKKCS